MTMKVSQGQLAFEWEHLQRKLRKRDPAKYRIVRRLQQIAPHPLFRVVAGEIESWERP